MYTIRSTLIWPRLIFMLLSVDYTLPCWWWTEIPPGIDTVEGYHKKYPHIPAHAIMPRQRGKPDYCFSPYMYGSCHKKETRWYFDTHSFSCKTFTYSGCGGNYNQFRYKKWCDEACRDKPQTECSKYGTCEYD